MPHKRRPTLSSASFSQDPSTRHAIVIARQAPEQSDEELRVSLEELAQLLRGLDVVVRDTLVQRRAATRGVLGEGKRKELAALIEEHAEALGEVPFLVFDGELSPRDTRALEEELKVEVIDRTGIILRVFEQRARTEVARLEVTLARLQHELPRVRDDKELVGRAEGGGGRGERGHTNVELRKLEIKERITQVRRDLERALATQKAQRERRAEVPLVALVGYTNAGKSSLLRALTGSEVLVEDKLFATLGTTVRALSPATTPRVLCADTVGFLRRLPNELLASFHSTLEEARAADLLLLVVDASDPEWREQLAVTRETLGAIEAEGVPSRLVLNKIDRVNAAERARLAKELPTALQVSSYEPDDVKRVRELILAFFDEQLVEGRVLVPHTEGKLLAAIHASARVVEEDYREEGAALVIRARSHDLERWQRALSEN